MHTHPTPAVGAAPLRFRAVGRGGATGPLSPYALGRGLVVGAAYGFFCVVAYLLSHQVSLGASLFPAAGVSLAGLLLSRRHAWPVILLCVGLTEWGVDLWHGAPFTVAVTFAVANTVEPLVSALIVERLAGRPFSFLQVRSILTLTFAACLSPVISATIASAGVAAAGLAPFWTWWERWWAGDLLGGLVVTAALVTWAEREPTKKMRPRAAFLMWMSIIVGATAYVVGGQRIPVVFLVAPLIVLLAVQGGAKGIGVAALTLGVLGELAAWAHTGPFWVGYSRPVGVQLDQLFVGASLFTMLVLHAASAQARRAESQERDLETIGRVANQVAHDITHLQSLMLANCELLSVQLDPRGQHWGALERIVQGANHTAELTAQLQRVMAPSSDAGATDVNGVLRSMEPLLRTAAGRHDLTVETSTRSDLVDVPATSVEQIALNLVLNARDAIGSEGHIGIATHLEGPTGGSPARLVLVVADDGRGMDERTLTHAFDAWFSDKPGASRGVGLAGVQRMVAASHGTVGISSMLGQGTVVRIEWPLAGPAAEAPIDGPVDGTAGPGGKAPAPPSGPQRGNVLVLTSHKELEDQLTGVLGAVGYTPHVASSTGQALELNRSLPSLEAALVESTLTGLNGASVAVRLDHDRSGLPVLLLGDVPPAIGYEMPDLTAHCPLPAADSSIRQWLGAVVPETGVR
ncbi:Signal transduction histidine kinase [Raineyella antarctica]|uniref:histidine kinase n=1 Tax=Raineyella antarctica TaxID=1577474 RepID=A0A1G6HMH8_9ACTN|nr:MASE1 domain-containing protein [Raineyella antarctica]SDB95353.1 Signal transduction histidine kinase [Raineyella antarctica]